VNRDLEAKARRLAGLKGCTTNLAARPDGTPVTAEFVISSYHHLWRLEKASACPSTTSGRGPSATTSANRWTPTLALCSPRARATQHVRV
jgi:hypothetical protein